MSDQVSLLKIWAMPTEAISFTITASSWQPAPAKPDKAMTDVEFGRRLWHELARRTQMA